MMLAIFIDDRVEAIRARIASAFLSPEAIVMGHP
jgi:hypothetical protein